MDTVIFIGACLAVLVGLGMLFVGTGGAKAAGLAIAVLLGGGGILASTFYTVDVGQAVVIKNPDGTIHSEDLTAGWGNKWPWQGIEEFDIRNQQAIHSAHGEDNDGTFITTQDKNGVTADYDVVVRYSIKADSVTDIVTDYQNQAQFKVRLIDQDIRSVVRAVPNGFSTIQVLTQRGEIEKKVLESLQTRWAESGVQVESVALQEIRYPEEVTARFQEAQNASTLQEKAKVDLETTKITAQNKIVEAESEAKANKILSESLTDEILEQRRLDTLREIGAVPGNLIIVPEGSTPFVQTQQPATAPAK